MNSQRVIIVHLRRANPTKHLSTSSKSEIKLRPESLGRALPLLDFSKGGLGSGLCQRRLVNKYFSIRLFLFQTNSKFYHHATTFYLRLQEKKFQFQSYLLPPKIVCPATNMLTHQILQVEESNLSLKNCTLLLTYRKFNQLTFLDKCKFISRPVCLKC